MKQEELNFYTFSGIVLLISEIWKQVYLTYIHGYYMWWHFPLQICSLPMYLCLLLPHTKKYRYDILNYLMTFGMVGGIAGLIGSFGLKYPRLSLSLHSIIWHVYLIVIGWVSGHIWMRVRRQRKDFKGACKIFALTAVLAYLINKAVYPYAGINLFYLNAKVMVDIPIFIHLVPLVGNRLTILLVIFAMVEFSRLTIEIWYVCCEEMKIREKEKKKAVGYRRH
ncbi:MAG: YwaF family protein [Erysipelotrichaceae bacterium]|jgi:hypothetical protein|nr:YwaF family protein [Erysipelotrichaceae bacterium]